MENIFIIEWQFVFFLFSLIDEMKITKNLNLRYHGYVFKIRQILKIVKMYLYTYNDFFNSDYLSILLF